MSFQIYWGDPPVAPGGGLFVTIFNKTAMSVLLKDFHYYPYRKTPNSNINGYASFIKGFSLLSLSQNTLAHKIKLKKPL